VVACLSLTGPEIRLPADRLRTLGPRVRDTAWAVSEMLGATRERVRARR